MSVRVLLSTLPLVSGRKNKVWKDKQLSDLCEGSWQARKLWVEAGRPQGGPLYDEKCRLRRDVRKRVRFCAARDERVKIRKRDRMFEKGHSNRFRAPKKKRKCDKMMIDGEVVSSSEVLLGKWVEHFGKVAKSRLESVDGLRDMMLKVDGLVHTSFDNEELLLDVPFTVDEVKAAIRKLKCGMAAGLDGLVAEHLKYAGESMVIWLRNIMNALIELEMIPGFLKKGVVVPVYKGGGKDPLLMNSYRGISILSKVLEFLGFMICWRLLGFLI